MADTRLVDLDSGNAEGTDIVYAVKDPSGVPLDRKIALSNIKDYILGGSPPTFTDAITVRSTDTGANAAPAVILYRDSASPADDDIIGQIKFDGEDSAGNQQTYGTITGQILDEASTSEDGALLFGVVTAGTVANEVRLDGSALSPVTSDGNALGTSSLMWSDLFLASGGVVNFNNGDVTLTHSSNALTLGGGAQLLADAATSTSAPPYSFSGDSNTGIARPAADTLAFSTGGIERVRIDSQSRFGLGTSPAAPFHTSTELSANAIFLLDKYNDLGGSEFRIRRAKGTLATPTAITTATQIGRFTFHGHDGTTFSEAASLNGYATSDWTTTSKPAFLTFQTTASNSTTPAERIRIDAAGNVGVGTSAPTSLLDVNDDSIRVRTSQTPATAGAAGNAGEIAWDANYIYVCVATNTWKRVGIATW